MDLITNGVVIKDVLKFVREYKNSKNNYNSKIKINDDLNTEFETTKMLFSS